MLCSLFYRDILCIDKTGTLTMNRAIMVGHLDSWGLDKEKVLQFAFLNSYFKTDQKYPLDDAILAHVYTNGYRFQPSKWKKLDEIPFDFIRRRVSIIMEREQEGEDKDPYGFDRVMVIKGALEEVMKVCSFMEDIDRGTTIPLSPEQFQRILNMSEEISNEGLRVIGVATKKLETVCLDLFLAHILYEHKCIYILDCNFQCVKTFEDFSITYFYQIRNYSFPHDSKVIDLNIS